MILPIRWLIQFDQLLLNETLSKDFLDKKNVDFLQKNIAYLKDISAKSYQINFCELFEEIAICKQIGARLGLVLEDI